MAAANTELSPDIHRILGAVVHVISCARHFSRTPTQYDIVKSLFLADRSHLNEWGRPITYDNYVAMKHGPVPSMAYDLLKSTDHDLAMFGLESAPWEKKPTQGAAIHYSARPGAEVYLEYLSDSDRDALEAACGTVLKLGFNQVRRLTHEDPAYVAAWPADADSGAYKMDLALLFDEPDADAAEDLVEYSEYVRAG